MRLIALTPARVGPAETSRREARYRSFAEDRFPVTVLDQPDEPAVPRSFDTPELIASSEGFVVDRARGLDLDPGDVVLPDCVLDTALAQLAGVVEARVHGIMRVTVAMLGGLGLRYGAVARNDAVAAALTRTIRTYDSSPRFLGTEVLDLPTEAVADTVRWNAALADHVATLAARGAQVVINGCSAVEVGEDRWAVPVVDPTRLAIRALALADELGIAAHHSGAR